MKNKSSLWVRCSAVVLVILILAGPVLLTAAGEGSDCEAALNKCYGDALWATFISLFNIAVFAMSFSSCIIGYEWCLLYYI